MTCVPMLLLNSFKIKLSEEGNRCCHLEVTIQSNKSKEKAEKELFHFAHEVNQCRWNDGVIGLFPNTYK